VIDLRIGGNLGVVRYIAVREFAANYVGMFGEVCIGGREDFNVIRYTGIMVTNNISELVAIYRLDQKE
jgi:hypothetical protein